MLTPSAGKAGPPGSRRLPRARHLLAAALVLILSGCASSPAANGPARPLFTSPSGVPPATPPTPRPGTTGTGSPEPESPAGSDPTPVRTTDTRASGDLPGWRQVFEEDFSAGDVPLGGFPGPLYQARWSAGYRDGVPDTAGQLSGGKSGYYPSKVLSVRDGALNWFMHSENGIFMGAAPTPKIPNASANPPRDNSFLYGRYSVRFRADTLAGFKTAWLFWPDSGVWPRDGEIDFPEGDLAKIIYGAAHYLEDGGDAFDKFDSDQSFSSWHIATMEWTPGRVEFFLDGESLGTSTTAPPTTPMHFILQTESCLPVCPLPETQGHVYLDWISMWVPA